VVNGPLSWVAKIKLEPLSLSGWLVFLEALDQLIPASDRRAEIFG
jgi:hypothetical protein